MNSTGILCHCGHRIIARDVLHRHFYREADQGFLHIRYRCSNCRRLGEKLVECDQWDEQMLEGESGDVTPREKRRFQRLGPITADEVSAFRSALDNPDALAKLAGDGKKP